MPVPVGDTIRAVQDVDPRLHLTGELGAHPHPLHVQPVNAPHLVRGRGLVGQGPARAGCRRGELHEQLARHRPAFPNRPTLVIALCWPPVHPVGVTPSGPTPGGQQGAAPGIEAVNARLK